MFVGWGMKGCLKGDVRVEESLLAVKKKKRGSEESAQRHIRKCCV